jgi:plastocyanin
VLCIAVIAAVAIAAIGFLLHGNLTPTTPSEVVVIIPNGASENLHLGFEPSKITIVIGVNNTVVWKNEDSDWHTAHSNIPEFNSGLIQSGDSFTHTFQRAGTYPYHCDPHPWMTGVVIVKGATSTGIITYWPYEQGKPPPLGFASLAMSPNKSEIFHAIALSNDRAISFAQDFGP